MATTMILNNADSFAMAFDAAWQHPREGSPEQESKETKLTAILSRLSDHPFMVDQPEKARQVALFRIRLLGLQ
jgi:hypothetical protein